jgi:protein TonB
VSGDAAVESNTYTDASGATVYNSAEVQPTFEGGRDAMVDYLRKNLKYPADGSEEGTIEVTFVVSENGSVRDAEVVSGPNDPALRAEAIRVVSGMPKWAPGKQGGSPVHTKFSLPITFQKIE